MQRSKFLSHPCIPSPLCGLALGHVGKPRGRLQHLLQVPLAQRTQLEASIGGVGVDAVAPDSTERVRAGVAQVQMLRLRLPEAAVGQHRPPVHGIEGSGGSGTWSYPHALKFKRTMMYNCTSIRYYVFFQKLFGGYITYSLKFEESLPVSVRRRLSCEGDLLCPGAAV